MEIIREDDTTGLAVVHTGTGDDYRLVRLDRREHRFRGVGRCATLVSEWSTPGARYVDDRRSRRSALDAYRRILRTEKAEEQADWERIFANDLGDIRCAVEKAVASGMTLDEIERDLWWSFADREGPVYANLFKGWFHAVYVKGEC
jgi:hypothetical protein